MTDVPDGKRDFFISFTGADRRWARWLARTLAEAGYRFWFQDQDFAGSIPHSIEKAHEQSNRTILLLSDAYAQSGYCRSEWEMRYQEDPGGEQDLLILFRVGPATPPPLLRRIAYVDLFGCQDEATDRELVINRLRQAIEPGTKLPLREMIFPGVEAPFPVPQHNLLPPNPDFVGREDVLVGLRGALTGGAAATITRAYAITGLGGIGKTQTALAYCYRHLADYRLIWWLRAAEPATLAADFMALAGPLGLPEERDQAKAVQAVKAKLQATPGWLLVLDNAEDPATVRPYLPGTGGGHALLTSRRTDWQGTAAQGILDVMSEAEALQLLTGRLDPDTLPGAELADAKALAKDLGYLPLALAQARAYMAETGETLAGYRELLRKSRPAVLAEGRAYPDYPEPVARTWDISLRAAEQQCLVARPLLELIAFFAPAALPREALDAEPEALPEGLRDKLARNRALGALHRFSLIRAQAGMITVHHLIQAVTCDGLNEMTKKAWAEAAVRLVNAALPDPPWEHTNWPAIGMLLPHALRAAEAAERLGAGLETAARVLNGTALYHQARAAWAEAELLYVRAIAMVEKSLGPEHPNFATDLSNLANLYQVTGRFAEAEPLYQHSIAIMEKNLRLEHFELATKLTNLACLYNATGHFAEAEPLFEQAVAISEMALGPNHPKVATFVNNLAGLYQNTGRFPEAEPLFERVVAIGETHLGPKHPELAARLNNLALLYQNTGRFPEAEPLLKRALAIDEEALGPEHPNVATDLINLALLYQATGRFPEAEPLLKRALAILEKAVPPDHPHRMRVRENYAGLLDRLGRPAEAAALRQAPGVR